MIEIASLVKTYGDFVAVDDISLEARRGEVFGFLGPNGAGKTTTIRIIVGLSVPTRGTVRVGGHDVVRHPAEAKQITGYIPDRPSLYEKLTGREHLQFFADLYSADWSAAWQRAEPLLRDLELLRWIDGRIENYSHGMKQKLVLVAALLHDPEVIVIDEPMVGLDALAQKQVKRLLRSQAAAGRTVFLTTHTLSVAEAVCDVIAIIHDGRIIARGSTEELKKLASSPGGALEDVFLELTYRPETGASAPDAVGP